ncbi:MAG: glycoside hydrolase domain-containing protein, partial [Acidobacteriota bacterium]
MKTKLTFAVIFSIVTALVSPAAAFYPKADPPGRSSTMIGIQKIDGRSGIAFTSDTAYLSDDDGASWRELAPARSNERVSAVYFRSRSDGFVVVADAANGRAELAATSDGGASWKRSTITDPSDDTSTIDLDTASIVVDGTALTVTFRMVTSSNFRGSISYRSIDGGITWSGGDQSVDLNFGAPDQVAIHSGDWSIVTDGKCAGFKVGCVQETKILAGGGRDITPTPVRELTRSQFETAQAAALNGPGGATRTSLNRGFDQCLAGSVAQMQIWWDNSPLFDSNIYMSGRNRACKAQPFTNNPAWIDQVSHMGWGLIPTIVGYQSPCTASATTVKLSYDPVMAETQGRGEADIATGDAVSIGLGPGTVLYYDMERYDPPSPDT